MMPPTPPRPIILASTSRYRAQLLERLKIAFTVIAPDTNETALDGESGRDTALRLACLKAHDCCDRVKNQLQFHEGLVIGADQTADLNGVLMGKPGTRANARAQLQSMRGQTVIFHTAVALLDMATGRCQSGVVPTTVTLRHYTDAQIEYYLDHENALDCAGSAKAEGLGVALIAAMTSDDPTALIGLPLIALTSMLANEGVEVLS